MKILYVITGLGMGGAEKVVCDLADQMSLRGHDVKIAYLTGEVLVKPSLPTVETVFLGLKSPVDFLAASYRYKRLINRFCPDVVHAHMVHANIFARLNRLTHSVPKLICTAHNSNEGGKARMLAYRMTNPLSDITTNVSQEATDALIAKGAFSKSEVMTVYNGIDLKKFEKTGAPITRDNSTLQLIAVGRFNEQKDYPNLLHAFEIFKKTTNKNAHLTIVGDGELRAHIETLIQSLRLGQDVTLLGRRSDIPELLSQSDVFVLASQHEGLPTVVIEAMACQCYVVATDCGGSAEILGETGKLVPIKDSQALATALSEVAALDDKDREQNNKAARDRVEQLFSLETAVQRWLELYDAE